MKIGIVSDTHGHQGNTHDAIRMLETFEVQQVIHCGDIGSAEIPSLFSQWKTHFVFGNVDYNTSELQDAIERHQGVCHKRFGSITLEERKIAFMHSDDQSRFIKEQNSGEWDLLCYGHTHVQKEHSVGETIVLNPGALYRCPERSIAIIDLPELSINIVKV